MKSQSGSLNTLGIPSIKFDTKYGTIGGNYKIFWNFGNTLFNVVISYNVSDKEVII